MTTLLQTSSRGGDPNPTVAEVFVVARISGAGRSWMFNRFGERQS